MYTVRDFRKDLKNALDAAERGEVIHIKRQNSVFTLALGGAVQIPQITKLETPETPRPEHVPSPQPIPETPVTIHQPPSPQLPQPCPDCMNPRVRCKHWDHDGFNSRWVNRITQEIREVTQ